MVAIILVGVVATVTVFSLWPLYQSYQFRLETTALYESLQELQLEAMTLDSDMYVRFTNKNGRWIAQSGGDEPIIKPQTIDLSHVKNLAPHQEIILYSNGTIEPKSVLELSYHDTHRWIDLRSGHLIQLHSSPPKDNGVERLIDLEKIKPRREK